MKLNSESWSCNRCGAGFIGRRPEHGMCTDCAQALQMCQACGAIPMHKLSELLNAAHQIGYDTARRELGLPVTGQYRPIGGGHAVLEVSQEVTPHGG